MYHKSCRRDYLRDQAVGRSKDEESRKQQHELEEAHASAFSKIRERIDREIVIEKKILKLSELREQYVSCLEKTNFPNPEYRAEKLKSKIEKYKDYQGIIGFTHSENNELTGKLQSCLIYNGMIKLDCAVTHAFQSGQSDMIKDVGLFLRQSILNKFSN